MRPIRATLLVLLCAAMFVESVAWGEDGIYLAPGTGVPNVLQIGERRKAAQPGAWQTDPRAAGVEYQTTPEGVVVVVRCKTRQCVTAQAIRVGSPEADVVRRYGAPHSQTKTADGVYYEYSGVGFEIAGGAVLRIYAFPMMRR